VLWSHSGAAFPQFLLQKETCYKAEVTAANKTKQNTPGKADLQ